MTSPQKYSNGAEEEILLSRRQLCVRWSCCSKTLQRREAAGILKPVRFNERMLRYWLSDVVAVEVAGFQGGHHE